MFQLGRALTLANKQLEAIKYYLEAADRRHAGSMNDLGEVYEYGVGVPMTCFQGWIACSLNQEPPNSIQEDDRTYVADSKTCRAALADCMTNCHGQAAGAP
jgi:hypothetical protein